MSWESKSLFCSAGVFQRNCKSMRQRTRWKMLWMLVMTVLVPLKSCAENGAVGTRNVQKSIFSPRMDYNQWKPLGRGDPLKNDPTFDYVPPVLDHVHYWVDPETKEAETKKNRGGQKSEILLLGVASKKPAVNAASDRKDTLYEPFPKYYHQEKGISYYPNQPTQRVGRPNYLPSMTSQVIPSLMSLATQVLNKTLFSKASESRIPYTVLMPPPMFTKEPSASHTTPMTPRPVTFQPLFTRKHPGVTVQESNLIYQSSSKEFESVPSLSWELSSSTEALSPPKSFIKIQFVPQNYSNKILEASDSNHNINYVTPPPLDDTKMTFKGQVSDDNDILDTYVRIEKPQAQMDHGGVEISNIHPMPIVFPNAEPFGHHSNYYNPVSAEIIRDMETLKPPLPTQRPVYTNPVVHILQKESIDTTTASSSAITTTPKLETLPTIPMETNTILSEITIATQQPMVTTSEEVTTVQTLTTDPLFKHYKQPMEPFKGPLYLIIQGHSKVKTYKPAKQIGGVMVQDTNEIPHHNDGLVDYSIKHLHGFLEKEDLIKKAETIAKRRQARTGNLLTLKHVVQTGLGAIDLNPESEEVLRRSDLKEAELEAGYKVVDSKDATTEKYMKGIVEEARKLE